MNKVLVDAEALMQVLNALVGPSYLIRELQAMRSPIIPDNPIDTLIKDFHDTTGKSWVENKPLVDSAPEDMGG